MWHRARRTLLFSMSQFGPESPGDARQCLPEGWQPAWELWVVGRTLRAAPGQGEVTLRVSSPFRCPGVVLSPCNATSNTVCATETDRGRPGKE